MSHMIEAFHKAVSITEGLYFEPICRRSPFFTPATPNLPCCVYLVVQAGDAGHDVCVCVLGKALGHVDHVARFSPFIQGESHQASLAATEQEMPSQADGQGEDRVA